MQAAPTTDDERALLAAVLAHPEEDGPRLEYADWLDGERGGVRCTECPEPDDAEPHPADLPCPACHGTGWLPHPRAEFIRVQCALASEVVPVGWEEDVEPVLRAREAALLKAHEAEWRKAGACPWCNGTGKIGPEVHRSGSDQTYGCGECDGTGDVGGLTDEVPCEGAWLSAYKVAFRRGFPDAVHAPFGEVFEWNNTGTWNLRGNGAGAEREYRPTRRALAWVRHHPISRIVLTDREPHQSGHEDWFWVTDDEAGPATSSHLLPPVLWDKIREEITTPTARVRAKRFHTKQAALDALAVAVCEVVREHKEGGS